MPGKILIAHQHQTEANLLDELLCVVGHQAQQTYDLPSTLDALHLCPDILLLDIDLLRQADDETKNRFRTGLELSEALCLRICASGTDFSQAQTISPFASGTIYTPTDGAELIEQIDSLLRIKAAERERNQAQEQLMLHRLEVEEGLRSASQIQHTLLPSKTLRSDCHNFAWSFSPCETVGGDLFNLLQISEDTLAAYILDVSGHGVSSALVTVSVHQSLSDRTSQIIKSQTDHPPYFQVTPPAAVLQALDNEYPFERFDKFFTMSYLLLERTSGKMCYANAGHPPPILVKPGGEVQRLDAGGTLIGMGGLIPYEQEEIELDAGDRIYLFSDGISEYEAPGGEMFGEKRLIDYLLSMQQEPLESALDGFMLMLHDFGEGTAPADDISLFAIEYTGNPSLD